MSEETKPSEGVNEGKEKLPADMGVSDLDAWLETAREQVKTSKLGLNAACLGLDRYGDDILSTSVVGNETVPTLHIQQGCPMSLWEMKKKHKAAAQAAMEPVLVDVEASEPQAEEDEWDDETGDSVEVVLLRDTAKNVADAIYEWLRLPKIDNVPYIKNHARVYVDIQKKIEAETEENLLRRQQEGAETVIRGSIMGLEDALTVSAGKAKGDYRNILLSVATRIIIEIHAHDMAVGKARNDSLREAARAKNAAQMCAASEPREGAKPLVVTEEDRLHRDN